MPGKPWFRNKVPNSSQGYLWNEDMTNCGYRGFKNYFSETDNIDVDKTLKDIKVFENFIQENFKKYDFAEIKKNKVFFVDYKEITTNEKITSQWDGFKTDIEKNTEYCLNCMALAMQQKIYTEMINMTNVIDTSSLQDFCNTNRINVRIINFEPMTQLKNLKVNCCGKLVSVRGIVLTASNIKLRCQYMAFECSLCSGTQILKQIDGVYSLPGKCPAKGCRAQSNFTPLFSSVHTKTITLQNLKIQELLNDEQSESGVPRTTECVLSEDLVFSCVPGDDITLTGIIKIKNAPEGSNNKNKQGSIFSIYLDTISVVNNTNHSEGSYESAAQITFNTTDYYAIQKIHSEPLLFRFLTHSLCPNIYGHEIVKAGLLLALFGGTKQENARSESHVLIVGDPGLGKSQMLQACTNVAPRGVYVCGSVSSSSGLTVTMTRESGGDYTLEAGALILADRGCCCIDEFDKMPSQHACLLEVMEQQTISIAKAGVLCNIPTHTTVLAAANPVGGHYNQAKTVSENLKISSPMLTRFDLVFILLDQPDKELDMLLSEHVLSIHSRFKRESSSSHSRTTKSSQQNELRFRLNLQPGECIDYLPHPLFKKYIAYAQKYVHPKLSEEAQDTIKQFYLKVRNQFKNKSCSPLTPRLLCSLVRLTQARAKVELREEATKTDALDVIDIMQNSLVDIFVDESGSLDTTRSNSGVGMSSRNQVSKFLKLLQERAEEHTKSLFSLKELQELSEEIRIRDKFYNILNTLNIQGFLLNKGGNNYQLVSVDF